MERNSKQFRHEVMRDDLTRARISTENALPQLETGQALLSVERFAMTANTLTYGVAGKRVGYWKFFPVAEDGWGRLPVWGIGVVEDGNDTGLTIGDRFFGYFPMSSHLVVMPSRVTLRGFLDGAAHRADMATIYNQYVQLSEQNGFSPELDNHQIVYRPLFMTCFVLDDFIVENDCFGAKAIILTSASSKTAIGTARLLNSRGITTIGLTSDANKDFVRDLGIYSDVLTYSEIHKLSSDARSVIIDMAGSPAVERDLRTHLRQQLVHYCRIGSTHWNAPGVDDMADLPGAPVQRFFAPTQIEKRTNEWGKDVFAQRMNDAWISFAHWVEGKVTFRMLKAPEQISDQYARLLGGADPSEALVFHQS